MPLSAARLRALAAARPAAGYTLANWGAAMDRVRELLLGFQREDGVDAPSAYPSDEQLPFFTHDHHHCDEDGELVDGMGLGTGWPLRRDVVDPRGAVRALRFVDVRATLESAEDDVKYDWPAADPAYVALLADASFYDFWPPSVDGGGVWAFVHYVCAQRWREREEAEREHAARGRALDATRRCATEIVAAFNSNPAWGAYHAESPPELLALLRGHPSQPAVRAEMMESM